MVQSVDTGRLGRLRGSQAAALLAQGTLGAELIERARQLTEQDEPGTKRLPPDQAAVLRCAVGAPQSTRFGGDAA